MRVRWSLFPKFFQDCDAAQLAALVRETGLDTINVLIREGFWVHPERLASDLPEFMKTLRDEGIPLHFATGPWTPGELAENPAPLDLLAESGISDLRVGYFRRKDPERKTLVSDPLSALKRAGDELAALGEACAARNIRAIYQVHHGMLITNASVIAPLLRDSPPDGLGVMLDPGNQSFEGSEDFGYAARLLGSRLAAVGVKDSLPYREDSATQDERKGWRRNFAPVFEGECNWFEVARGLRDTGFGGTLVFMPFYHSDDPGRMRETLKREVAYLRDVFARVGRE